MAVLSDGEREAATREAVHELFVRPNLTANFDFDELKAAADATDEWIDDNASSYNSALPAGNFRSNATLAQKTILFAYVAFKRAGLI